MAQTAATEPPKQSLEELEKSIEATLAQYRSSFDVPSPTPSRDDRDVSKDLSSDAYYSRLNTFKTETYFAKPLCLSPLCCAALGWQNVEPDVIQCPKCNSAIWILFHPNLNKEAHDKLAQQYLRMLATSHEEKCVFSKYAMRWLKIMEKLTTQQNSTKHEKGEADIPTGDQDILSKKLPVYVPPYLLSLSNQFLVFEDTSKNGSVTHHKIQENSSKILSMLPECQYEVYVPDAAKDFYHVPSSSRRNSKQTAVLLAIFGWSIDQSDRGCVRCKICLSKTLLPSRKRSQDVINRGNEDPEVKLQLMDSHRVYCPYVSGFSFGASHSNEVGWRVVAQNLVRYAMKEYRDAGGRVKLADLRVDEA